MAIRTDYVAGEERLASQVNEENTAIIASKNFVDLYAPNIDILQSTRDMSDASGTVTVAHGLGGIPKLVMVTAMCKVGSAPEPCLHSQGSSNGTINKCTAQYDSANTNNYQPINDNGNAIYIMANNGSPQGQTATITLDATNISIVWTKTASPSASTIYLTITAFKFS